MRSCSRTGWSSLPVRSVRLGHSSHDANALSEDRRDPTHRFHQLLGGGRDTLAIYDTARFISSEVATYCIEQAFRAAVLLATGDAGKRYILPHAK